MKAAAGFDPLLRRPFSVFEVLRDGRGTPTGLTILSKRIGPSTRLLYDVRAGDRVACLGPLGRPWPLDEEPGRALMVAGGVGLAPFVTLAETLGARGVPMTLFYGARRGAELFCLDLFARLGVELVLTTEDGSAGERGLVTAPLERALAATTVNAEHAETAEGRAAVPAGSASAASIGGLHVYACGPEPMMKAVARLSMRYGVACHVSMERIMGCGMGGCYSCVVPVRTARGSHHVRSCVAGPVMAAEEIVWA
ncbi:MAG: dihydroorotate dehydrogenase electron transfer subunit [Chloroflexota bacterium]|nr:dihydroorotate dehydrogenase electron transfer subunit [Chloroflexota bacterium]